MNQPVQRAESVSLRRFLGESAHYGLPDFLSIILGLLMLPVMTAILSPAANDHPQDSRPGSIGGADPGLPLATGIVSKSEREFDGRLVRSLLTRGRRSEWHAQLEMAPKPMPTLLKYAGAPDLDANQNEDETDDDVANIGAGGFPALPVNVIVRLFGHPSQPRDFKVRAHPLLPSCRNASIASRDGITLAWSDAGASPKRMAPRRRLDRQPPNSP